MHIGPDSPYGQSTAVLVVRVADVLLLVGVVVEKLVMDELTVDVLVTALVGVEELVVGVLVVGVDVDV